MGGRFLNSHCTRFQFYLCHSGVDCVSDVYGKFRCGICPQGSTGNGLACSELEDPCAANPCYQGKTIIYHER